MKFLCLNCDEGMKLETTTGPREGSLEAVFSCPRCRYQIAMLTNPWETQLVQTLGVTIGGRASPVAPYERILDGLVRTGNEAQGAHDTEPNSSSCPFADMFSKAELVESPAGVQWSDAATVRLDRIPSFIRPMVQRAIERYTIEQGYQLVTDEIMDEARLKLGM
jgi:hypothetical protein